MSASRSPRQTPLWPAILLPMVLVAAGCQLLSKEQRQDPDILREGRELDAAHCYQCHYLYQPEDYSDTAWAPIVRDMAHRAHLTPLQGEKILAWMQWANDFPPAERQRRLESGQTTIADPASESPAQTAPTAPIAPIEGNTP